MGKLTVPPRRGPVRRRAVRAATGLLILAAAGCRVAEAPPPAGGRGERGGSSPAVAPTEARLDAACDLAARVVDDALHATVRPEETPLSALLGTPDEDGCRLTAVGSFADLPEEVESPVDLLWGSFEEGGWHEDPRYASDSEETSAVGMWKRGVLCVMGAVWGLPAAPQEEREPRGEELRYDVMVECVPAGPPTIPSAGRRA